VTERESDTDTDTVGSVAGKVNMTHEFVRLKWGMTLVQGDW